MVWLHCVVITATRDQFLPSELTCCCQLMQPVKLSQSILILILIPWLGEVQEGELIFLHFLLVSVTGQRDKCSEISREAVNMRQFNLCSSALMRSLVVMLGTGGEYLPPGV